MGSCDFLIDAIDDIIAIRAVRADYLIALRKDANFGKGGHAIIVDKYGRLFAHQLEDWRREMKGLSEAAAVHDGGVQRGINFLLSRHEKRCDGGFCVGPLAKMGRYGA